ncbi:hypothetical protein AUQ48_05155 [Kocuria flava]|uniref:Uncharacterized protein n=1 Tax=Kocuria flava TaxID=446860 RepID=A0A2N4T0H1_9MICC|nr:hypothetical protein AUQ48_05155 [Kocuria flava]
MVTSRSSGSRTTPRISRRCSAICSRSAAEPCGGGGAAPAAAAAASRHAARHAGVARRAVSGRPGVRSIIGRSRRGRAARTGRAAAVPAGGAGAAGRARSGWTTVAPVVACR